MNNMNGSREKKNSAAGFFSKNLLFLAIAVFAAACISQSVMLSSGTLSMQVGADPKEIFIDGLSNVYVDVTNKDVTDIKDITLKIFETGLLEKQGSCEQTLASMRPNQSFTLRCTVRAPIEIVGDSVDNEIRVQAVFSKNLQLIQSIDFMTADWYERQKITGLRTKPKKYAYRDKNVEVSVDFSDEMPFVIRSNKTYYMYITVRNIGSGTMTQIGTPLISDLSTKKEIAKCVFEDVYYAVGKKFPRIACVLAPPETETQQTVDLIMTLGYNYDIRDSTTIRVKT